jgi:hypothetical protein
MRRPVGSILLLALCLWSPGASLLLGAAADPHACTDHVCRCRGAARPEAPAPACHKQGAGPISPVLDARCAHHAETGTIVGVRPFTVTTPVAVRSDPPAARVALAPDAAPAPAFGRIDIPPPRPIA